MTYEKKRIYILVKTYPTISEKYAELVCTAGILEDGSWVRLYPIQFRRLDFSQKYPKYAWIEAEITKNTNDFRPETYRPRLDSIIHDVQEKPKNPDWNKRREIIFKNTKVHTNMATLIQEAKEKHTSLAIFKPTKINGFTIEPTARDWDANKVANLKSLSQQLSLLQSHEEIVKEYSLVQKVPYKFSYKFTDDCGRESKLMIEDWEIGMLYFNCLKGSNGDEAIATEKVKNKYLNEFAQKDLYFFLGTTMQHHLRSRNPFIIIGVYPAPFLPPTQGSLFAV